MRIKMAPVMLFLGSLIILNFSFQSKLEATPNKVLTRRFHNVIRDWLAGLSAQEICSRNEGHFCSTVQNKGQGICYGANGSFCSTATNTGQGICYGADGHFCSTASNTAQGICYTLEENFCSTLTEKDDQTWIARLKEACGINDPTE